MPFTSFKDAVGVPVYPELALHLDVSWQVSGRWPAGGDLGEKANLAVALAWMR